MFRQKLSIKLIVSLTVVILLIFLVSGYVTFNVYTKLFTEEISKQFAKANEQAAARVDFRIQNMYKSTNYIVFHPYIEDILRRSAERDDNSRFKRILDQDELSRLVGQIRLDEPKLSTMYVYNMKGSGYFFENDAGTVIPLDTGTYETIRRSLEGSNGELVWLPLRVASSSGSGYRNVISVSRLMKNKQQELYGTLIMLYDPTIFGSILDELTEGEKAKLFLLDSGGKVIYSNQTADDPSSRELLAVTGSRIVRQDREPTFVARSQAGETGVSLVSALSLQSISSKSKVIFQIALYSGGASALCASLLIFFTGRKLLGPLQQLVNGMARLRGGKFDTRVRISTQDELAYIGQSFNEMAANIESLIKEVYERKLHEREAELTALQAQLNPHFLYNTLDTIYLKVYLGENDAEASELILSLSGLLRYALQDANMKTTVRDEVEHIRKYMHIQSARIGDRLETFVHVDEETLELPTIRLIMQPLVENAFVHAFRHKPKLCLLRIKATLLPGRELGLELDERVLCIEVTDNGCGMTEEQVRHVNRLIDDRLEEQPDHRGQHRGGIGLRTVVRRIRLLYGAPYGLQVESKPDSGTLMRLVLPANAGMELSLPPAISG